MEILTTEEHVYVVAAVGRVSNPLNVELYEKLYNSLTTAEKIKVHSLAGRMEFS